MRKFRKWSERVTYVIIGIWIIAIMVLLWSMPQQFQDRNISVHYAPEMDFAADTWLAQARNLTSQSELYDEDVKARVYIMSDRTFYPLVATASYKSLAISYGFLNVAFVPLIPEDRKEPSPIEKVIAHELMHLTIEDRFGFWETLKTPKWKVEGYADYIARRSAVVPNEGFEKLCNPSVPREDVSPYFRYHLAVSYLMEQKAMSFVDIQKSDLKFEDVLADASGYYCANQDEFAQRNGFDLK